MNHKCKSSILLGYDFHQIPECLTTDGVRIPSVWYMYDKHTHSILHSIQYCPFCGEKFPSERLMPIL